MHGAHQRVLNGRTLIEYLERRALVTRGALLEADVVVTKAERRNLNYRVSRGEGPDLFIKHGTRAGQTGTVAREASTYELLADAPIEAAFGTYRVPYLGYDAAAGVLILEALPNAEDLHSYHFRSGRLCDRIAVDLGRSLAALHGATRGLAHSGSSAAPCARPFAFTLGCPDAALLRDASAVGLELIRLVQRRPSFSRELERLAAEWQPETLIHGDVKFSNCLAWRRRKGGRVEGIKWVDWEFAGLGDPRWDVGSVLSAYLFLWVFSIPMPCSTEPERMLAAARFSLTEIQRVCRLFLASYLAAFTPPTPLQPFIRSTLRMAAARLMQTAYEHATGANQLKAPVVTLLQVAANVLDRPDVARSQLFGIPDDLPSLPHAAQVS